MKRWLKAALSLTTLKKTLSFGNIFAATRFELRLRIVDKFPFKNILVLAPHPDDEVFGMGGTIKKLTLTGAKVTVAFFCDGSGGVPEGRKAEEEIGLGIRRDEKLIEQRKNEAEAAGKILGISEAVFWGYPDGKLAAGQATMKALADLIDRIKPDIIFLPSFLDNHADHRVVNEIFLNTAGKVLEDNFPVWAYEIWTPIFPNRLIDISFYIKTKKEAILAHQSQQSGRKYDKAIEGLNQYRAEINGLSGFAEAFFAAPLGVYRELYRKS
ncbi:MAG: PIG-L family deacetylase [Patescibacteria group bacterium]